MTKRCFRLVEYGRALNYLKTSANRRLNPGWMRLMSHLALQMQPLPFLPQNDTLCLQQISTGRVFVLLPSYQWKWLQRLRNGFPRLLCPCFVLGLNSFVTARGNWVEMDVINQQRSLKWAVLLSVCHFSSVSTKLSFPAENVAPAGGAREKLATSWGALVAMRRNICGSSWLLIGW